MFDKAWQFVVELIIAGLIVGGALFLYPDVVADYMQGLLLIVAWHLSWKIVRHPWAKQKLWTWIKDIKPMYAYALVFIIGGLLSVLYWYSAGKTIQNLAAAEKRLKQAHESVTVLPPSIQAVIADADYPVGYQMSGVRWSDRFGELRVFVMNPNSIAYYDLDFTIRSDTPYAEVAQDTGLPDVYILPPVQEGEFRQEVVKQGTGQRIMNPLQLIASNAGHRIRCKRLLPKEKLGLLVATVEVDDAVKPMPQGIFSRAYVLKAPVNKQEWANWFGHGGQQFGGRIDELYKPGKHLPAWGDVSGSYTENGEQKSFSQRVDAQNLIRDAIKKIPK